MEYLQDFSDLKNYRYSSVDKSPLSRYILNPYYWTPLANYLPIWLHANLVTLIGLLGIIILLIITYIAEGLDGRYTWLSYACAVGIWFYSTMDNLDGKQARRTKTSSPLGELVDHGCDALQCCLGGLVQSAGMGLGYSYYTIWVIGIASVPFYFSSWEEYYTKTLYLGYINGPTEGLLLGSLCSLASAIWGPQIYFIPMSIVNQSEFWSIALSPFELCTKLILEFFQVHRDLILLDVLVFFMGIAVFIVHVPACIFNVYYTPHRKEGMGTALFKTYPIFLFVFAGYLIAASDICWDPKVFWILAITSTLCFSVYTTQVILAYIVNRHYPSPSAIWALLSLGLVLKYNKDLTYLQSLTMIKVFCSFFIVYYIYFIESVFVQFCDYLKISWYYVPNQKQLLKESELKNK
eukprot:NODE_528_length_7173_cov_0.249929.p2 type:complete len:407 gc:universal NODE_528_length_7173_cov_0.249929:5173-3953(-)